MLTYLLNHALSWLVCAHASNTCSRVHAMYPAFQKKCSVLLAAPCRARTRDAQQQSLVHMNARGMPRRQDIMAEPSQHLISQAQHCA